jgi:hypothetical protein
MPEEPEIETQELQEAIDEMHHEREERAAEEHRNRWTKYVGLATAIFAVFAALGALQSGALVNEAMISRLKASDAWNEYQSDKQKIHLYTTEADKLLDAGAVASTTAPSGKGLHKMTPGDRLSEFVAQISKENEKTMELSKEAKNLEKESTERLEKHHHFAFSVTAIQVAIALGAVSALTKMKWIWAISLVFGIIGVGLFAQGFL